MQQACTQNDVHSAGVPSQIFRINASYHRNSRLCVEDTRKQTGNPKRSRHHGRSGAAASGNVPAVAASTFIVSLRMRVNVRGAMPGKPLVAKLEPNLKCGLPKQKTTSGWRKKPLCALRLLLTMATYSSESSKARLGSFDYEMMCASHWYCARPIASLKQSRRHAAVTTTVWRIAIFSARLSALLSALFSALFRALFKRTP
jgi:hypothetical protein